MLGCNTSVCSFWIKWSSLATWQAVRGLSPVIITTWMQRKKKLSIKNQAVWVSVHTVFSDYLHDVMLLGSLWWQPCCHSSGDRTPPWTRRNASRTPKHHDSSPGPMWPKKIVFSLDSILFQFSWDKTTQTVSDSFEKHQKTTCWWLRCPNSL